MDPEPVQLVGHHPPQLLALGVLLQHAARHAAPERQRELLTNLAGAGCDHVLGIGVDPDQPGHLDVEPGLLSHLKDHRLLDALAEVVRPAGERPQVGVDAVLKQDAAVLGCDTTDGGRDRTVGRRRGHAPSERSPSA